MRFRSVAKDTLARIGPFPARVVESEPMLFRADWDFAMSNGGTITMLFLDAIKDVVPRDSVVIDSRSHMLMRGWFPCIPGWHHDDVRRTGPNGQPDYENQGYHSRHLMCVVDALDQPTEALTEFMIGNIDVPWPVPDGTNVYSTWDAYLNTMSAKPRIIQVKSGQIVDFDAHAFHRGVPAKYTGWRFFIRLTTDTGIKPENKIRKNANVYLPAVSNGW